MREALGFWIEETCQHLWRLVRHIRGVTRDRSGRWYWYLERKSRAGYFVIRLLRFPCFSYRAYPRQNAGWAAVGVRSADDPSVWMIFDVQVSSPYRKQGLGTLLVRAAIRLARRHRARALHGKVTLDDAREHPFLPDWYAQLGFTVQPTPEPDPSPRFTAADFWMDFD
jgi:GNAT superfamily N-acetyltransferase